MTSGSEQGPAKNVNHQTEEHHVRPSKTRRVGAACDECRMRKSKCNGERPSCAQCVRRYGPLANCTWGARNARGRGSSQLEIAQIMERINHLERHGRTGSSRNANPLKQDNLPGLFSQGGEIDHQVNNQGHDMPDSLEDELENTTETDCNPNSRDRVNETKQLNDEHLHPPFAQDDLPSNKARITDGAKGLALPLDYNLPGRRRADHLLSVYARLAGSLFPFLDWEQIQSLYQKLWTGKDLGNDGATFLCLLNVLFSIGCALDSFTKPTDRTKAALVFYERARELLTFDMIQSPSVLTVQCFLLLGQYLQSTDDPQQCLAFVGLATRTAHSLGLDVPSTSLNARSDHQSSVLRNTWLGCVLMDRTISMTFGRKPLIAHDAAIAVQLPYSAVGPECRKPQEQQVSPSAPRYFFEEAILLYEHVSGMMTDVSGACIVDELDSDPYSKHLGPFGTKAAANILEMDRRLSLWYRNLPAHLTHRPGCPKPQVEELQTNVLWLRYQHVRVLLFRPVMSRFCSHIERPSGLEHQLPRAIAFQCSLLCARAALDAIFFYDRIMSNRRLEELDELLPAWWYSIFYISTHATVLVAARLHPLLAAELKEVTIMDAWQAVRRILTRYSTFSRYASKCATALTRLFEQVPQQVRQQQQAGDKGQAASDAVVTEEHGDTQGFDGVQNLDAHDAIGVDADISIEPGTLPLRNALSPFYWAPTQQPQGQLPSLSDGPSGSYSSTYPLFEDSDLLLDTADMSWLNTLPSQLYKS